MPGSHARARGGSEPDIQPAPALAWGSPHASRACHLCQSNLAGERAIARFIGDRAVEICGRCAGDGSGARARRDLGACADCGRPVALSAGAAVIRAGAVAVVHSRCPPDDAGGRPEIQPLGSALARIRRVPKLARRAGIVAAAAVALIALGAPRSHSDAVEPELLSLDARTAASATGDGDRLGLHVASHERPVVHALTLATGDGGLYDLTWYHPLAGQRLLPIRADRRFGAGRDGDRPTECGRGHCGVDLGGVRGSVVHAARPGIVARIVRDPNRSGGKYVRLEHPEGFVTSYMHLDRIRPDLVVGVEVAAGEPLGILGRTGIHHSGPHLHFSVARRTDRGLVFLDPEPMLGRAVVLAEAAPYPWPTAPDPEPAPDLLATANSDVSAEAVPDIETTAGAKQKPASAPVARTALAPVTGGRLGSDGSLASSSLYSAGLSD
ncbi:MAG TPA: M23 family metallopeptidase [Kofleriaceae bacterium]|nr:M23 family metallopeptidase [Kofleriaceae bacterium]